MQILLFLRKMKNIFTNTLDPQIIHHNKITFFFINLLKYQNYALCLKKISKRKNLNKDALAKLSYNYIKRAECEDLAKTMQILLSLCKMKNILISILDLQIIHHNKITCFVISLLKYQNYAVRLKKYSKRKNLNKDALAKLFYNYIKRAQCKNLAKIMQILLFICKMKSIFTSILDSLQTIHHRKIIYFVLSLPCIKLADLGPKFKD